MKKAALILISSVAIAGCAQLPTTEDAASADYGSFPTDYKGIVRAHVSDIFYDPSSVQYRNISSPKKYWLGNKISGAKYGYLVCATVNGKNLHGAYTGFSTHGYLIRNGSVVEFVEDGWWWGTDIC